MVLAGLMVGCYELFARKGIDSVADLKGKSIGVGTVSSLSQQLLTLMAAEIGLDPVKDIHWVTDPSVKPIELFVQGKIDAFLGFPPEPQELRARHVGHFIVNSGVDRPWSQYFCCMLASNREFVAMHPVATKRVGVPSLRQRMSARLNPHAQHSSLLSVVSSPATTMPSRR
jgi:NitT/TauT family transport system substrate-binding protein